MGAVSANESRPTGERAASKRVAGVSASVSQTSDIGSWFNAAPLALAAECYAALGWPVFPLRPGGKTPLTRHGLADATTDPAQVRAWWSARPDANIGLTTGGRFDVLDIDCKPAAGDHPAVDARPWLRRFAAAGLLGGAVGLGRTRNNGLHVWFPAGGGGNHSTPQGVDFRGVGGYVVGPPSRVPSDSPDLPGEYTWQTFPEGSGTPLDWDAVARLVRPVRAVEAPARVFRSDGQPSSENALAGLLRRVTGAVVGERNAVLFWAACRLAERGELDRHGRELASAAASTGLDPGEIVATIRSAGRIPVGAR